MNTTTLLSGSNKSRKSYLELMFVASIVCAACVIQLFVPHKLIVMNFFFLPTVVAAYYFGIRSVLRCHCD